MAEPGRTSTDLTDTPDEAPSCSSLTTKELQQNLRAVKQRERPVRLLFEIPSSRVIDQTLSKYVVRHTRARARTHTHRPHQGQLCGWLLGATSRQKCRAQVYEIVVMRSGSFDSHRVSVERRYSDFSRLHHRLLEEFGEELEDVVLPRKLLTGNFSPDVISERRRALQDYLAQLYSVRSVRHSPHFPAFLTEQEQRRGHSLLRAGQFQPALEQLRLVLEIQEKLLPWQSATLTVPILCALAVCHRDLEQPEQAFAAAQRALPAVRRYGLKRYRGPLLDLLVDLGYELGRPVAQIQDELTALRDTERGEVSSRSLKELVVQEFV